MRVLIDARVLANSTPRKLAVLCDLGIERRHRLQLDDRDSSDFKSWMDSLAEWQREDWLTALAIGSRDDGLEPSRIEIRIVADAVSDWKADCPSLTLEDALGLLGEKFQIVLEGDAEDRAFLLAMSSDEQKRFFLDCEQEKGCLEYVLGGGVTSMIKKAEIDKGRNRLRDARKALRPSAGFVTGLRPPTGSSYDARRRRRAAPP